MIMLLRSNLILRYVGIEEVLSRSLKGRSANSDFLVARSARLRSRDSYSCILEFVNRISPSFAASNPLLHVDWNLRCCGEAVFKSPSPIPPFSFCNFIQ